MIFYIRLFFLCSSYLLLCPVAVAQSDTVAVVKLLTRVRQLLGSNLDSAMHLAVSAERLSQGIGFHNGYVRALISKANIHQVRKNMPLALRTFDSAARIARAKHFYVDYLR